MKERPRHRRRLEDRIRANCCEFHGLTPAEYERHVYQIVRTVREAKKRGVV